MPMLFRSRFSRYVLAAVGIGFGLLFVFGDPARYQSTPSLVLLSHVPLVPLDFWGVLSVVYGLLLLTNRTKTIGYAVGFCLFLIVAVSLIYTLPSAGPKNLFAVEGVVIAVVYHFLAIRFSVADRFFA